MPPSKNASQHADHTQLFATMDKDFALHLETHVCESGEGAISVRLETFNGPPVMNNQGKSFSDTLLVPRANQVTFMQPELAMEEFELASNSVSGLSARISFNWLTKNLPLTKDIEQFQDDWQTLTEFTAAVAARHVLECGTWAPKSEEEMSKIATDFLSGGDTSDLSDYDEGLLSLMQNDFTSSIPSAAQAAVHLSIWKEGQAKNKLMQRQAANTGSTPHRRYTESAPFNAYPEELPPGTSFLAEVFIRIGIAEITVYELKPSSKALSIFEDFRDAIVTESNQPVKTSADTARNVQNGKSLTAAT